MKYPAFIAGLLGALTFSAASATEWAVDYGQSKLAFAGTQGGVPFDGRFKKFDADISFDPDHLDQSGVRIVIDMASAISGSDERDAALLQPEWFDVKRYPKAIFEASKISHKSGKLYEADGMLTIRNIPRKAKLVFRLDIDSAKARAVGSLLLSRRSFDVGTGAWASDKFVGYKVTVDFDIRATPRK